MPILDNTINIGDVHNKWTIVDDKIFYVRNKIYLKCKCECGTIKKVNRSNLVRGLTKSCGGTLCHSSLADLTGLRFTNWTVIGLSLSDRKIRGVFWNCKCICGIIRAVRGFSLKNGESKSCGYPTCKPKFRNLVGKKFGRLTVISFHPRKRNNKWNCICECGNKTTVTTGALTLKNTKSCGLSCKARPSIIRSIENTAYAQHKTGASNRKIISHLTKEQYLKIIKKPCVYCKEFSKRKNRASGIYMKLNSCDRKNNEPYYKLSNSQSTCFKCQIMKMCLSDKEFRSHIKFIAKNILYHTT